MIGDDDVPIGLLQCSLHPREGIHTPIIQVDSGACEFGAQEMRIIFRIFNIQYSHFGSRCISKSLRGQLLSRYRPYQAKL